MDNNLIITSFLNNINIVEEVFPNLNSSEDVPHYAYRLISKNKEILLEIISDDMLKINSRYFKT